MTCDYSPVLLLSGSIFVFFCPNYVMEGQLFRKNSYLTLLKAYGFKLSSLRCGKNVCYFAPRRARLLWITSAGMIEWSQKSRAKKIPRASSKLTPKNPLPNSIVIGEPHDDPKGCYWIGGGLLKCSIEPNERFKPTSNLVKEIKISLKQKGIPVTLKPVD